MATAVVGEDDPVGADLGRCDGVVDALDYPGAALFSVAVSALLVALTQSATLSWPEIVGLTGIFAIASLLFLLQERRAHEPMIALDLWGDRMIATANASLLLGTMTLIGVDSIAGLTHDAIDLPRD